MDSRLPWLFLKVEVTRILAMSFLDDQNCREKKKRSMTNESTFGESYNSTYTQTCVLRCTQNMS